MTNREMHWEVSHSDKYKTCANAAKVNPPMPRTAEQCNLSSNYISWWHVRTSSSAGASSRPSTSQKYHAHGWMLVAPTKDAVTNIDKYSLFSKIPYLGRRLAMTTQIIQMDRSFRQECYCPCKCVMPPSADRQRTRQPTISFFIPFFALPFSLPFNLIRVPECKGERRRCKPPSSATAQTPQAG